MDQTSQQMGQTNLLKLDKVQNEAILFLLDRRCTGVSTLQDECNRLLQFLLAAVEFGV